MRVFSEYPVKDLNAGQLSVTLFPFPSWACASSHSHTAAINAGIGEAIIEQGLEPAMQGHQHVAVASLSVAPASNLQKSLLEVGSIQKFCLMQCSLQTRAARFKYDTNVH